MSAPVVTCKYLANSGLGSSPGPPLRTEQLQHARFHHGPVQLDRRHHQFVRQRTAAVFEIESIDAEETDGFGDATRDGFGRAHVKRAVRRLRFELRSRRRRPTALASELVDELPVMRPELLLRLFVRARDVTRRM